jgi:hypothetical protein
MELTRTHPWLAVPSLTLEPDQVRNTWNEMRLCKLRTGKRQAKEEVDREFIEKDNGRQKRVWMILHGNSLGHFQTTL